MGKTICVNEPSKEALEALKEYRFKLIMRKVREGKIKLNNEVELAQELATSGQAINS
jgi:hypothetical protein